MSEHPQVAGPSQHLPTVTTSSVIDTPLSRTSHMTDAVVKSVVEHRDVVAEELLEHNLHVRNLYDKLFPLSNHMKDDISSYLEQSPQYDSQRKVWKDIPSNPRHEKELYVPLKNRIDAILKEFGYTATRSVVVSCNADMPHDEGQRKGKGKSSPDIVVIGRSKTEKEVGYNFRPTARNERPKPTYKNLVTPFEVKLDKHFHAEKNLGQISVYARQCFIQQHNRRSVYVLLLSQTWARLYVFDRSGACHSEDIDINDKADVFIQIVLGVCNPDCATVGCDTSIYWSKDGVRHIKTSDEKGEAVTYPIENDSGKALVHRETIRGRGTCCWEVKGGLIVKDQWSSVGRTPEVDFLEASKGLPFVGQMVAYSKGTSTAKLRGFNDYDHDVSPKDKKHFRDRDFWRVTFKNGGKPLSKFSSPEEVLYTMRDAIEGHKNLWEKGILHRDISIDNILITPSSGTAARRRGTLTDLSMAVWIDRKTSLDGKDFRTGTPAFQSFSVLRSRGSKENISKVPHDYLDDFESALYVLFWVTTIFEGPGKKATHICEDIHQWLDLNSTTAANSKFVLIFTAHLHNTQPFFGPIFDRLIHELKEFLQPHVLRKFRSPAGTKFPALECLKEFARDDYMTVLGFFDKAIADLEADDGFKERNKPVSPNESKTGGSSRILGKRARSELLVAGDTRRRSKRIIEKEAKRT
ncbi:hypothetical protein CPC08DRAFT_651015 [Agrocybe pediades]|nr:hypothetical protein CPC08DRAFT_651015 [Agrocybe pediades]